MVIKPEDVKTKAKERRDQQLRQEVRQLEKLIDEELLNSFKGKNRVDYALREKLPQKVLNQVITDYQNAGWEVDFADPAPDEEYEAWGYLEFKKR